MRQFRGTLAEDLFGPPPGVSTMWDNRMLNRSCFTGHGLVRFATACTDISDVELIGHQESLRQTCVYVCVCVEQDRLDLFQYSSFYIITLIDVR
jgi:hypothetical protein